MESIAATMNRVAEIHQRVTPARSSGSFAAHLERQMTPSGDEASDRAGRVVGELQRQVVTTTGSADLDSYLHSHGVKGKNGRLEGSGLLQEVSGAWHGTGRLLAPAAKAWEEMRAAAAADGVDLRTIDTYRSYDVQASAYQDHLTGKKKANVLPPGKSEHGHGLAVDVTNGSLVGPGDPEWNWLNANAGRFGWHPISNESWHWEFRGGK